MQLYALLGSVTLVFVVVVVALVAVVSHLCPRRRRIVYFRDSDCSKAKRPPSTQETVPLIVDKFVSKHYKVDQQWCGTVVCISLFHVITVIIINTLLLAIFSSSLSVPDAVGWPGFEGEFAIFPSLTLTFSLVSLSEKSLCSVIFLSSV